MPPKMTLKKARIQATPKTSQAPAGVPSIVNWELQEDGKCWVIFLFVYDGYKEYKWCQDPKNAGKNIFDYRLGLDRDVPPTAYGRNNTKN